MRLDTGNTNKSVFSVLAVCDAVGAVVVVVRSSGISVAGFTTCATVFDAVVVVDADVCGSIGSSVETPFTNAVTAIPQTAIKQKFYIISFFFYRYKNQQ